MSTAPTSIADLDDDFENPKEPPARTGDSLADLPDGEYEFQIDSAEQKDTKAGPMVKFNLVVVSDGPHSGSKAEHVYFLMKKEKDGEGDTGNYVKNEMQIAQLNKDLATLGFDVENWKKASGRAWSTQLPLALGVIAGVQFKGKKKKNGRFVNLYINERGASDGKPERFGPEELKPQTLPGFEVD